MTVVVKPTENKLEPGGETTIEIEVRDYKGAPVAYGEVTVLAIDESVLAMTGYKIVSPLKAFHPELIFNQLKKFSQRQKMLYRALVPTKDTKDTKDETVNNEGNILNVRT